MTDERDGVDAHVARWAAFWKDDPRFSPEIEGALVRMYDIRKWAHRADAAAFAGNDDFTLEDYKTLHALMVQPYPTEREVWTVVIGVILFALAITAITVGFANAIN